MFFSLATTILPVFLVMGLGYAIQRYGLVGDRFFLEANRLLFYVCLPCLLFVKSAAVSVDMAFNPLLIVGSITSLGLIFAASYGFARLAGYPARVVGVFSQAASRGNMAYMGLAVIYYGFGDEGLVWAGLVVASLVAPVNILSIVVLSVARSSCGSRGLVFWLREFFQNPLILSTMAGLVVALSGLGIPQVLNTGLELVAEMTLPLALMATGGSFVPQPVKFSRDVMFITLFKNILMPLCTLICLTWLGVTGIGLAAGVLIAAMPTAMVSVVMASELGGDMQVAGSAILVTTLASLVTVSGWLYVLKTWFGV